MNRHGRLLLLGVFYVSVAVIVLQILGRLVALAFPADPLVSYKYGDYNMMGMLVVCVIGLCYLVGSYVNLHIKNREEQSQTGDEDV